MTAPGMYEMLTPDFSFSDDRGSLTQLVHRGYEQVNVLFTKAGVLRGNHYHKETAEAFYIVSGAVDVELTKNGQSETRRFFAGQFFEIRPFVSHSMRFAEDCTMVALYSKCVERADGGKDIFADLGD